MDLLTLFYRVMLALKRVTWPARIKIRGYPAIITIKGTRLHLGEGVVLNSAGRRYHAHMHSPLKLLLDRPGAEIIIGGATRLNGACLHAGQSIRIGKRCLLASGVQVIDSNAHRLCMTAPEQRIQSVDACRPVVIGDDVWIGMNSIILPGTVIGSGCVIGAGCVVSGDIPAGSIVRQAPLQISGAGGE